MKKRVQLNDDALDDWKPMNGKTLISFWRQPLDEDDENDPMAWENDINGPLADMEMEAIPRLGELIDFVREGTWKVVEVMWCLTPPPVLAEYRHLHPRYHVMIRLAMVEG